MAKRNIFAQRQKTDRQANVWFDRTNDNAPFQAFSGKEEQEQIGEEMLAEIRQKIRFHKFRKIWLSSAAAVLILFSVGILTFQFSKSPSLGPAELVWTSYTTHKGEYKKISLPDSSIVYLRPGSHLEVATPFVQQNRNVKLVEGEAFFDIRHNPQHPLVVEASQITTQVLGTTFIISNYKAMDHISVMLLTGKVAVNTEKTQLGLLKPHERLSFNKTSGKAELNTIDNDMSENWQSGEYMLNNVPMKELAFALGNTFGFEVKFGDDRLEKLHITTQFNRKDKIKDILEQLKLIHGLDYRIKDKEVILMK